MINLLVLTVSKPLIATEPAMILPVFWISSLPVPPLKTKLPPFMVPLLSRVSLPAAKLNLPVPVTPTTLLLVKVSSAVVPE